MKMLLVVFALLLAALPAVAQPTKVDTDAKLKLSVWASTFRADDWSDWTPGTAAKGRRCPGDDDDDNDGIVAAWPWRADADRTQIGIGLAIPTSDTWQVGAWLEDVHTDFAPLSGTAIGLRVEYTLW